MESNNQDCCQKKVVSDPTEYAGTYSLIRKFDGDKDDNCADACIYSKEGDESVGSEYCFKAVIIGAATISDQCGASSAGSTFAPTTLADPVSQIEEANTRIEEASEEIIKEYTKVANVTAAVSLVSNISYALEVLGEKKRGNREITTTIVSLADVSTCFDFEENFQKLLEILKVVNDDKISLINEYVRVLSVHLPNVTICDATEKARIKNATASDIKIAEEKTTEYIEKSDTKIWSLTQIVEEETQYIEDLNQDLVNSGSTTIPPNTIPVVVIEYITARPAATATEAPTTATLTTKEGCSFYLCLNYPKIIYLRVEQTSKLLNCLALKSLLLCIA